MPLSRHLRRAVPAAGLALLLAGCAFEGPQSVLDPAGPVAQRQLDLFMWTYWLSWIVIIGVAGVAITAVVRFRRRDETLPAQTHGNPLLEIGLTIIPVLIVIAVAVPTVRTIFATENRVEPGPDDLIVNVTGYQWWWSFEYPQYGFTTANELHVPNGTRVVLNLDSADVLHSFWAPRFAGKRDLIPNNENQLWFVAETEPGVYYGQCAELCLGAHAYMRFRVVVDDAAGFETWVAAFQEAQPDEAMAAGTNAQLVQDDALIQQGRQLFAQKGCAACHAVDDYYSDGTRIGQDGFPNLTNFGLRTSVAAGVLDNTPENLADWLRDPQAVKPGNYMPTLWADDDPQREAQIDALVAYLLSLGVDGGPQAVTTGTITTASIGGDHGDR